MHRNENLLLLRGLQCRTQIEAPLSVVIERCPHLEVVITRRGILLGNLGVERLDVCSRTKRRLLNRTSFIPVCFILMIVVALYLIIILVGGCLILTTLSVERVQELTARMVTISEWLLILMLIQHRRRRLLLILLL